MELLWIIGGIFAFLLLFWLAARRPQRKFFGPFEERPERHEADQKQFGPFGGRSYDGP